MKDIAHNETDKQLEEIEKQLEEIYKRAYKKADAKLLDYLQKFEEEDEEMKNRLASKIILVALYKKWRIKRMQSGKEWAELRDSLSKDFTHANQMSMEIIKEYMPEVYANNYNYIAYEIENELKIDTSFTPYEEKTLEQLIAEMPDVLPRPTIDVARDLRWNKQKIQSVITQGILKGESIPKIAKRLQKVADMNYTSAVRNARTAVTAAENAARVDGFKRAESMGIKMKMRWIATLDNRTRHEHRQMDGELSEVGGVFSNGCRFPGDPRGRPETVWNCRCTLGSEIEGFETDFATMERYSKLGNMSYQEWKKGKYSPDKKKKKTKK